MLCVCSLELRLPFEFSVRYVEMYDVYVYCLNILLILKGQVPKEFLVTRLGIQ